MRRLPLQPLLGFLAIAAAGIFFFLTYNSFLPTAQVAVANGNIAAFSAADKQIQFVSVPAASVGSHDLTKAIYESQFKGQRPLLPLQAILDGDRIDLRALTSNATSSLAAVLPDERLIAVQATLAGVAAGAVRTGSVVDLQASSNGLGDTQGSSFVKVLCIAGKSDGCRNLVPGSALTAAKGTNLGGSGGSDGASVLMVVALPTADASALSGGTVTATLNPFCSFDEHGHFVSIRADFACAVPQGRLASTKPATAKPQTPPAAATTTTTATTTSPTTTSTK